MRSAAGNPSVTGASAGDTSPFRGGKDGRRGGRMIAAPTGDGDAAGGASPSPTEGRKAGRRGRRPLRETGERATARVARSQNPYFKTQIIKRKF